MFIGKTTIRVADDDPDVLYDKKARKDSYNDVLRGILTRPLHETQDNEQEDINET